MKKLIFILLIFPFFIFAQTKIKLEESGGVYTVPCKINELPFDFIFDTGASSISLSIEAANSLIKSGKLTKDDIIGKTNLSIANGEIVEGVIVNIRDFEISGLKFKNIEAIITIGQNVPLLLGQSAIRKFGKFSIDYDQNILTIEKNREPTKTKFTIRSPFGDNLDKDLAKSYFDFYENKEYIIDNVHVEVADFSIKTDRNGDQTIHLEFDTTNNSDFDISTWVQNIADPMKFISIVVTIFTEEGKTYTKHVSISQGAGGTLLAHNTTSELTLSIKTRKNKPTGYLIEVKDVAL